MRLRTVVFVSGAVLMGLEMAASRVIATHFGSSIYVWGAIIGIFLAALSGGYYLGGKIADARPSFLVLNAILFASGSWLMLIPYYANPLCRALVQSDLGDRLGPVLATTLLFAGPSTLMGIASPFAVRLAARTVERMGNVSGQLYALSTLGSIAGTMVTAFWLVPSFGVRAVVQSLGACLVVLPLIVLPRPRDRVAFAAPLLLIALVVLVLDPAPVVQLRPGQQIVFEQDSAYHHVLVLDDASADKRALQFNNQPQSAISLVPPYETRTLYTDSFPLARIFRPELSRILVIGGGGGIAPRQFVADDPAVQVDLVEIDPVVADVCRRWFHVEEGPRLRIHVEDGRRFVRRATEKYDLVILDAFTTRGEVPFHLTTREFLTEVRSILAPGGVVLANINAALEGPKSEILRAEYRTLTAVFAKVYAFPRPQKFEREAGKGIYAALKRVVILVGVDSAEVWTNEKVMERAEHLVASGRVRTPTYLDDASYFLAEPLDTAGAPLLTDDYAPVDTMVF